MGRFYDASIIPPELRRTYDVYDRIRELGLELGSFDTDVRSLRGSNICSAIFHESGLVYLSGIGLGDHQMSEDPERVAHGQQAGQRCADWHVRTLHWAITCGGEGGDLNDLLYTIKVLGMVVSTDVDFRSAPAVVNGYSLRWQSIFGGGAGHYAADGLDAGGYAGVHARSAIGGFTGRFSLEPEIIVALPPELNRAIIANRGWVFPLIPSVYDRIAAAHA